MSSNLFNVKSTGAHTQTPKTNLDYSADFPEIMKTLSFKEDKKIITIVC